jgi:hypothetical protein
MFKAANYFVQARASSGRTLSGYPKSRKIDSGTNPLSSQNQFDVGTAYIRKMSPMVRDFLENGLDPSKIADELLRRRIDTPSGTRWNAGLAAQLVEAVQMSDRKYPKSHLGRRKR